MICMTEPYAVPSRSWSPCSTSSSSPSFLVQRPLGTCLAACSGTLLSLANRAIFSKIDECDRFSVCFAMPERSNHETGQMNGRVKDWEVQDARGS